MKTIRNTILTGLLLGAATTWSHAAVLYSSLVNTPTLVNDENAYALPDAATVSSLGKSTTDTGTLYFRYTVTNPASNSTTESGTSYYYAGMSLYNGADDENLGVGNGWFEHAYSAFGPDGSLDLNSATPDSGVSYQRVKSTDTTTIVFRVDYNSNAADTITVWLNPNFSQTEAAQNTALKTSFTADASFDRLYLREGGMPGTGDGWSFSNVAIADSFASIGSVPEPSAALIGGLGMLALLRRRR